MGGGLPGGGGMGGFGIDWYRNDLKSFVMNARVKIVRLYKLGFNIIEQLQDTRSHVETL